jgi:hypothetical protein
MALGVLEALKAANRAAIVIGINGILPAVKQIETGGTLATVDFNMFKIGCTATRAAVGHHKREPLPEKVMLPAEVIEDQLQGMAGAGRPAHLPGMVGRRTLVHDEPLPASFDLGQQNNPALCSRPVSGSSCGVTELLSVVAGEAARC